MSVSSDSELAAADLNVPEQDSISGGDDDADLLAPVMPLSPVKSPARPSSHHRRSSRFSLDGNVVVGDHADISEEQLEACQDVFKRIMSQRFAKDFQEIEDHPDFYDMIETPMYLSKVEDKLDIPSYQNFSEFFSDVDLCISNGMLLHHDNPNMKVKGQELRNALLNFSAKYKKFLPRDALKSVDIVQAPKFERSTGKKLRATDDMKKILSGAVKLSSLSDDGTVSGSDDGVDPGDLRQVMDGQVLKATEIQEDTALSWNDQRDVLKVVDKEELFPHGMSYGVEPELRDEGAPDGPESYRNFMAMMRDMVSRGVTDTVLASGVLSSFFINNPKHEVTESLKEWLLGLVASSMSLGPKAAYAIDRMVNCKVIRDSLPHDSPIVVRDRLASQPWVSSAVPTVEGVRAMLSKVGMRNVGEPVVTDKASRVSLESFQALVRVVALAACGKGYDSLTELFDLLVGILTSQYVRDTRKSTNGYVHAVAGSLNAVVRKMVEVNEKRVAADDHLSLLFEKGIVGNIWEALEICVALDHEPMRYNIALTCLCVALKSNSKYFIDAQPPPRALSNLAKELGALQFTRPPIDVKDEFLTLYCTLMCANIVAMGADPHDTSGLTDIQELALGIKYKIPPPGSVVDPHSKTVFLRHILEAMTKGNFLEVCLFSDCGEQHATDQGASKS